MATIALQLDEARADMRASFERDGLVHLDTVYRIARRLAGNAADADDLVQETMFNAYRAWHQYRPGSNARAWLLTILRHTFVNEYRRRTSRRETSEIVAWDALPPPAGSPEADPEGAFFDAQVDGEVARAIAALPTPFRDVLLLTDVEGLRYHESAQVLGVPEGTIKSRLSRARHILKARLAGYAAATGWIRPAPVTD